MWSPPCFGPLSGRGPCAQFTPSPVAFSYFQGNWAQSAGPAVGAPRASGGASFVLGPPRLSGPQAALPDSSVVSAGQPLSRPSVCPTPGRPPPGTGWNVVPGSPQSEVTGPPPLSGDRGLSVAPICRTQASANHPRGSFHVEDLGLQALKISKEILEDAHPGDAAAGCVGRWRHPGLPGCAGGSAASQEAVCTHTQNNSAQGRSRRRHGARFAQSQLRAPRGPRMSPQTPRKPLAPRAGARPAGSFRQGPGVGPPLVRGGPQPPGPGVVMEVLRALAAFLAGGQAGRGVGRRKTAS